MIEVEKKFLIDQGNIQKFLEGAEFINEKKFTGTYWGIADYIQMPLPQRFY